MSSIALAPDVRNFFRTTTAFDELERENNVTTRRPEA